MSGESTGTSRVPTGHTDVSSPPMGKGIKYQPMNKDSCPAVPVEVERIDIGDFKDAKPRQDKTAEHTSVPVNSSGNPSPDLKNNDQDEHLDIMNDDGNATGDGGSIDVKELGFDINEPHPTNSED